MYPLRAFLDAQALQVNQHTVVWQSTARTGLYPLVLQGVVSEEDHQLLGDFLLTEIRNKTTVTYPSLSELLLQLQVRQPTTTGIHIKLLHSSIT